MDELLSDAERSKLDPGPDGSFYRSPRMVTHADDGFLDRLTMLYARELSPESCVFDAMGSWVSHLPSTEFERVIGHGLNAEELRHNDRLDEWFVQDLNAEQSLPLEDGAVDAVLCALSVQYLQYPATVFREFARVLGSDGVLVVSFTNRMFPTKAVRAWREASMEERTDLVTDYVEVTDAFGSVRAVRDRPATDPFHAVVARR